MGTTRPLEKARDGSWLETIRLTQLPARSGALGRRKAGHIMDSRCYGCMSGSYPVRSRVRIPGGLPMPNSPAYMRAYMAKRYTKRREELISRLGGCCVQCGRKDDLEFDHIDPKTKTLNIGKRLAGVSRERLEAEIPKLQLLCGSCHDTKTILDHGKTPARGTHGTLSAYRYCRCADCRSAKATHDRAYRLRRQSVAT